MAKSFKNLIADLQQQHRPKPTPADTPASQKERVNRDPLSRILGHQRDRKEDRLTKSVYTGTISVSPKGYAFVNNPQGDIFIPEHLVRGAITGDTVETTVEKGRDGRSCGAVKKITARGTSKITGVIVKSNIGLTLECAGKGLGCTVVVNDATEKDLGQTVSVLINSYPGDQDENIHATIDRYLGSRDNPSNDIPIICSEFGIEMTFPDAVLKAARKIPEDVPATEIARRKDLRDFPFITIDGVTAKDFDDAVYLEPQSFGWRLFVAIADVSHYVTPTSKIGAEARRRGTSVYFPSHCIPMLPEELSNGICSLKPNCDRLVMVARMDFDYEGDLIEKEVFEAVINSKRRMIYEDVASILQKNASEEPWLVEMLSLMNDCRLALNEKRKGRGALDMDMVEATAVIGENGALETIIRYERNDAHRLIEEFMLAANEAVASYLAEKEPSRPQLLRVHDKPDPDSIERLISMANSAEINTSAKNKRTSQLLKEILVNAVGHPAEKAIQSLVLRSMKQACYMATTAEGKEHFGLASEHYTHFTSPIRRYPDLMVHRLLKQVLHQHTEEWPEKTEMAEEAIHASMCERISVNAERAMFKVLCGRWMIDKLGQEFDATVTGAAAAGVFVELNDVPVEGILPTDMLLEVFDCEDGGFDNKTREFVLPGADVDLGIGSPVKVRAEEVRILKRQIIFSLVL